MGTQSSGANVKPGAYEPCDSYPMQGNLKPNGITGRSKRVGDSDDPLGVAFSLSSSKKFSFNCSACVLLVKLGYQLVLPHGLIRINIKIKSTIIIIYLTPFSSIKYSNTYYKTYIYHHLITIDFILCAHPYVFNICLV